MLDKLLNVNPVILSLIATIFTWGVTLLGASLVFFFKKVNKNIMDGMLSFAGGVMIAASFWSLLEPGINLAYELKINAWLVAFLGFMSGGIILYLGDKICKYILKKLKKDNKDSFRRSVLLVTSISLHNIPEGLSVGVAFGSLFYNLNEGVLLSAIIFAIGIGLQNFPEGSAVSLPLRREGYGRAKSFFYGQLSGFVEPISGVIGALLVMKVKIILPFLLCFAAGAMIYVVTLELIPESQTNKSKDLMAFFTLIGFSIMMILDVALG